MNAYRLASGAVECGPEGLFVGGVALLARHANADFAPRSIDSVNDELSQRYGAEIDATSRLAGLKFVASCLKSGDLPRAQIGALMLRFPDPPQFLAKSQQDIEHWALLEAMLDTAGLLKVSVWDPSKHPRLGAPPNRGWFAPTDPATRWLRQTSGWAIRSVELGAAFGHLALVVAEKSFDLFALVDYGSSFLEDTRLLPSTGDPVADEIESFKDPPKTLEELRMSPKHYQLGYDRHHIVEQNPDNIAKRLAYWRLLLEKFGRAVIDDESNLVWVPRRKHWRICAEYQSKEPGDPLGRIHRKVVNELDFAAQREAGLAAMRRAGVLQ